MWNTKSIEDMSIMNLVNPQELLEGLESAKMHYSMRLADTVSISDAYNTKYVASISLNPSTLIVRITHDEIIYKLNINFFTREQITAMRLEGEHLYENLLDDNFQSWYDHRSNFERELQKLCDDYDFNRPNFLDEEKIDELVEKLNKIDYSGFTDFLMRSYKVAPQLEKKEDKVIECLQEFRSNSEYKLSDKIIFAHIQRGKTKFGKPLEVNPHEALTLLEMKSLKPYLMAIVGSLPELEAPFCEKEFYLKLVSGL